MLRITVNNSGQLYCVYALPAFFVLCGPNSRVLCVLHTYAFMCTFFVMNGDH